MMNDHCCATRVPGPSRDRSDLHCLLSNCSHKAHASLLSHENTVCTSRILVPNDLYVCEAVHTLANFSMCAIPPNPLVQIAAKAHVGLRFECLHSTILPDCLCMWQVCLCNRNTENNPDHAQSVQGELFPTCTTTSLPRLSHPPGYWPWPLV